MTEPRVLTTPRLAVSMHAWDPYFLDPGTKDEAPTPMLRRHLDALARLEPALSRVRVDVGWSASQPKDAVPDRGSWYHRRLRWLFDQLDARGLRPYVVVHQSPAWARTAQLDPATKALSNTDVKRYPDSPAAIAPWAEWMAREFAPWVREWEVWNEPNLAAFTGYTPTGQPKNTPELYVQLLKSFHDGAKTGNPDCVLIGGNVSQSDWAWIEGAYRAGLGSWCDVLGVHPYQGNQSVAPSSSNAAAVAKAGTGWEKARIALGYPMIGQVMARYGDGAKPIWATEVGWSASASGVGTGGVPDRWVDMRAKAASYITDMLEVFLSDPAPAFQNTRLVTLYQLFDPLSISSHQRGFAAVDRDGALNPLGWSLLRFNRAADLRGATPRVLYR